MPVNALIPHEALRQLPSALRTAMLAHGHTQNDVAQICGVAQPQISRALAARRKRLTPPMAKLCRYAGIDLEAPATDAVEQARRAFEQVLARHPYAASLMYEWCEALGPWLDDQQ